MRINNCSIYRLFIEKLIETNQSVLSGYLVFIINKLVICHDMPGDGLLRGSFNSLDLYNKFHQEIKFCQTEHLELK